MMKEGLYRTMDLYRYRRQILRMQDNHKKEFFSDSYGMCGLEIEFGVRYSRRCRTYIATGLKKLKAVVGSLGKFVQDASVGQDLNVEIVLMPLDEQRLEAVFRDIKEILDFYEDFIFDDNCGVHANFRADDMQKRLFYSALVCGGYDADRFCHSKYKYDFLRIARREDGTWLSYDDYIAHQDRVSAKYASVNFLKENLIEFRSLKFQWSDIEYIYDLYRCHCLYADACTLRATAGKVAYLADYVRGAL